MPSPANDYRAPTKSNGRAGQKIEHHSKHPMCHDVSKFVHEALRPLFVEAAKIGELHHCCFSQAVATLV